MYRFQSRAEEVIDKHVSMRYTTGPTQGTAYLIVHHLLISIVLLEQAEEGHDVGVLMDDCVVSMSLLKFGNY